MKLSTVVLNLVVGTEPHKFNTCIHRTFRSRKNKMCVVNFIFLYFYCSKSLAAELLKLTHRSLLFNGTQVKNYCLSTIVDSNQQNVDEGGGRADALGAEQELVLFRGVDPQQREDGGL